MNVEIKGVRLTGDVTRPADQLMTRLEVTLELRDTDLEGQLVLHLPPELRQPSEILAEVETRIRQMGGHLAQAAVQWRRSGS